MLVRIFTSRHDVRAQYTLTHF